MLSSLARPRWEKLKAGECQQCGKLTGIQAEVKGFELRNSSNFRTMRRARRVALVYYVHNTLLSHDTLPYKFGGRESGAGRDHVPWRTSEVPKLHLSDSAFFAPTVLALNHLSHHPHSLHTTLFDIS